jgi:hypothetical protein
MLIKVPADRPHEEMMRVMPGAGMEMAVNAMGASLSAPRRSANFNHPFLPMFGGKSLTFLVGTVRSVNGIGPIIPTIQVGGDPVPMNGNGGNSYTPLALDPGKQNADGVSYAVLQVTPDAKSGELLTGSVCEIIHDSQATNIDPVTGATSTSISPGNGRCALAMILWNGNTAMRVLPIVFFNLVYERVTPPAGAGAVKHLFY